MTGPLSGARVLVLAGMGPVPFTSMLLADMGADVVRIERPPTRQARALAQTALMPERIDIVNRGVDAVTVDLKSPEGRESVLALCTQADVFIEGFRPGVVERLGLGPEEILAVNPAIVFARLTGYGQAGSRARDAGHDINYVAQSGLLHALSSVDGVPQPPLNLLGDYAGGGAMAAFGIVCGIVSARATGRGQVVDAAMLDGVAVLTAKIQALRAAGVHSDDPGTNLLDGAAPFYTCYRCADDRYIAVGAIEEDFYWEFISRLGVDTSGWPGQNDQDSWPQLRKLIADTILARPQSAWIEIYRGVDACVTPVLDFDSAAADLHNAERGVFERIDGVLHPAPAPRFSGTPARQPAAPMCGVSEFDDVAARWRA